jgi:hypothetical protein
MGSFTSSQPSGSMLLGREDPVTEATPVDRWTQLENLAEMEPECLPENLSSRATLAMRCSSHCCAWYAVIARMPLGSSPIGSVLGAFESLEWLLPFRELVTVRRARRGDHRGRSMGMAASRALEPSSSP